MIITKKERTLFASTPLDYKCLETLANTDIIPATQKQFLEENILNKAPVRRVAVAMMTNTAFSDPNTAYPFRHQQFGLRQKTKLSGGQPIVDSDTVDNCRLYVTAMKAINFKMTSPQFQMIISKTTMY